jgi:hypothetical protein
VATDRGFEPHLLQGLPRSNRNLHHWPNLTGEQVTEVVDFQGRCSRHRRHPAKNYEEVRRSEPSNLNEGARVTPGCSLCRRLAGADRAANSILYRPYRAFSYARQYCHSEKPECKRNFHMVRKLSLPSRLAAHIGLAAKFFAMAPRANSLETLTKSWPVPR